MTILQSAVGGLVESHSAVIEKHRGFKGVVDTVLTVLASFLIFYPFTYIYQKVNNIQYSFFKTHSASLMGDLDNSLQAVDTANQEAFVY